MSEQNEIDQTKMIIAVMLTLLILWGIGWAGWQIQRYLNAVVQKAPNK